MSKETVVLHRWGVLQIPHKIHIKEKKYNYFELNSNFLSHYKFYPANSWCLLRRTRDKPLGETICFSIEYARVLRAHVDRLEKLPSKEQQLSRTQHFILSSHAAMFVLHTQYGPCGIPLNPMIRQQNYLLSTYSRRMHLTLFICSLGVFVQRQTPECQISPEKWRQKNDPDLVEVLSRLWSKSKA